jgi:hypothetical protein
MTRTVDDIIDDIIFGVETMQVEYIELIGDSDEELVERAKESANEYLTHVKKLQEELQGQQDTIDHLEYVIDAKNRAIEKFGGNPSESDVELVKPTGKKQREGKTLGTRIREGIGAVTDTVRNYIPSVGNHSDPLQPRGNEGLKPIILDNKSLLPEKNLRGPDSVVEGAKTSQQQLIDIIPMTKDELCTEAKMQANNIKKPLSVILSRLNLENLTALKQEYMIAGKDKDVIIRNIKRIMFLAYALEDTNSAVYRNIAGDNTKLPVYLMNGDHPVRKEIAKSFKSFTSTQRNEIMKKLWSTKLKDATDTVEKAYKFAIEMQAKYLFEKECPEVLLEIE